MSKCFRFCTLLFLIFTPALFASYLDREKAVVVTVPVADAVGKALQLLDPSKPVYQLYKELPFSPQAGPQSCPRIHQFIYNEVGTLLDKTSDGAEVLIEFPHLFYQETAGGKKCNQFWIQAKNVMCLTEFKERCGNCSSIPVPIDFSSPSNPEQYDAILTLILPWRDAASGIVYSAGTRFKRAPEFDTGQGYAIHFFSPLENKVKIGLVEKDASLVDYPKDYKSAKKLFVELLKKWANVSPGKIAYGWGCCSFIETYPEGVFSKASAKRGNDDLEYWIRPDACMPHRGFDCSGLILRAAQIARLYHFYKNTTTIGLNLKDITAVEDLEEGDLILFRGHVMVITDLKAHLFVEAVSYSSGYGCVHEIPLAQTFENVTTYSDLYNCCKNNIPLKVKNKQGAFIKEIESFRLLKCGLPA